MTTRVEKIRELIEQALAPEVFDLYDDSHSHAGHAGAQAGGGHFYATIVSNSFEGLTPVRRHQLVYQALGDMMKADIHALSIQAFTPVEFKQKEKQE